MREDPLKRTIIKQDQEKGGRVVKENQGGGGVVKTPLSLSM
jgi:hypothetical protein